MSDVNEPQPGHFCWIELASTDPRAAKQFYGDLFDWSVNDQDMGAMGFYTIFQKSGRDAAAVYGMAPEQRAQGMPPNWLTYVSVASADERAARAVSLGGTLLQPPFDVGEHGRMAVVGDPHGAVFAVWQAKKHRGVLIRDEPDTLCWNELATHDMAASSAFYSDLFGWTLKPDTDYAEIHREGAGIGGIRLIRDGEPTRPNWMPYFAVGDCDAMTEKATSLGGLTCFGPVDIPNVGRFSVVADPEGAVFALFRGM